MRLTSRDLGMSMRDLGANQAASHRLIRVMMSEAGVIGGRNPASHGTWNLRYTVFIATKSFRLARRRQPGFETAGAGDSGYNTQRQAGFSQRARSRTQTRCIQHAHLAQDGYSGVIAARGLCHVGCASPFGWFS